MKKVFVFCIGGTGIRVMKSAIMLMAGGMNTNGYVVVPIIVDPHLDLEEKKRLHSLIEAYKELHHRSINHGDETLNPLNGFFETNIRTIEDLNNQTNDTKETAGSKESFKSYISVSSIGLSDKQGSTNINSFLISTLFSTKNLNNPLSVGFKGNPNVGTVVLGEMIEGAEWFKSFKQQCEKDDRVFIISSIFGGTGASGFPLLEKKIRLSQNEQAVKNALMGAVTVLPYYKLKDPATTNSDIDSTNFYTKTKAALSYYNGKTLSDYLYYVGEQSLRQEYENDEKKQDDKANFIELVAASALFDFLKRETPQRKQFLTRAIEDDKEALDLLSMGPGYKNIVKSVADFMLLRLLVEGLPNEKWFPLKKTRGLDNAFYRDSAFQSLSRFCDSYGDWYTELAQNKRAFTPIKSSDTKDMRQWIRGMELDANDDSYYLLEMVKASNKFKNKEHDNKFRFFLQFAYEAIDKYTKKIYK